MINYGRALIGFMIVAFGVSMTIHVSDVGLEPWSAALIGLSKIAFTYGTWNFLSHVVFISLTFLLEKRPPRLGTFLNMIIVSPLIDFFVFLDLFPEINQIIVKYLFFMLGVVISSFGMSLVITSEVGAGSKTQFYVVLHGKTKWKLSYCKNIVELMGLTIAILVGGPLFIGTILFIFVSSSSIEFFVNQLKKQT